LPPNAAAVTLAVVVLVAGAIFEDRLLPTREGRRIDYKESRYGRIEVIESGWRGLHFQ
jgi:hypothetical protein